MERFVEQTLLFDFYGELLNEHQRSIYEDAVFNDLSLSEIADEHGISRQGVHDLIKRVNKTLEGYENKLHLIEKFLGAKEKLRKIDELTSEYMESNNLECITKIQNITKDIIDNF
ncbi:MAG: YlxM family DNA-binding protein [Lachnospira sp.]|nr:YlxM family DNA-binding protein [Lachnospira sp.]